MTAEDKNQLLHLIQKLQEGNISRKEIAYLSNFYTSHQKSSDWPIDIKLKEVIKEKIFSEIQSKLSSPKKEEPKVIPIYKRSLFKYAIAASLVLLISLSFVLNNNGKNTFESTIVESSIKIGTDKATLTLEDGTDVVLEKGQKYAANHLVSNGETLIYNSKSDVTTEIVYNYLTIPRGGQYLIKLEDGTQVWLNSDSKLKYPVNFVEGKTREVELVYGEAYFDVSPSTDHQGSDFKVYHNKQEVQVLGTQFNIKAYRDESNIYTTLVEGKVAIKTNDKNQLLVPNEQSNLNLNNNTLSINLVDVYDVTSWKNGVFSFKHKSLKEITNVLSRWYDVDFIFIDNKVQDVKFMGVLSKKQSLEEILIIIKNTNFIKSYQIDHKTITIK